MIFSVLQAQKIGKFNLKITVIRLISRIKPKQELHEDIFD
tara:strand:- start:3961 stop:4080 length:120 start_codon:yes stop_codon:yes gene_type:complete